MIDLGTGRKPASLASVPLSLDEMQLLVQLLELTELPTVLAYRAGHDDENARFQAMAAARASLEQRELLRGNTIHEDLEARLRAVSRPHWVVNIRLFVAGTVSGICLANGDNGVCGVVLRGPDSYLVREVPPRELTAVVLAALPRARPLEFHGLNAPTDRLTDLLDRAGDPAATARELVELGADPQAALAVGRAVARPVAHTSMIGIVYGEGTRDIAPGQVAVLDTADGRILVTASSAQDGTQWSSLSAGTPGRVRHALQTLIDSLPTRPQFPTFAD